jgi:hypothetical protein
MQSRLCSLLFLAVPLLCLGQDSVFEPSSLDDPPAVTQSLKPQQQQVIHATIQSGFLFDAPAPHRTEPGARPTKNDFAASGAIEVSPKPKKEHFHWGRAMFETFSLFGIEQAYVVHDDYRWVTVENGVPFNHYWRDYKQSLSAWIHSGWNDGDPNMYGYVGHPIQGLATSYIQIQNDPASEKLGFSNTKAYWKRVLKATIFNAVYSTQWNIGPLSEPTIEKYGTKARPPWNQDGSWPCTTKNCYTGVGQIDLVMTPLAGMGWLVGEDWLDKNVTERIEAHTTSRVLIDTVRCGLNPIQVGTNFLHGKRPWYRASRDHGAGSF